MPKLSVDSGSVRFESDRFKTKVIVHGNDRQLKAEVRTFPKGDTAFTVLELGFSAPPGIFPHESDILASENILLYLSEQQLISIGEAINAARKSCFPLKDSWGQPIGPYPIHCTSCGAGFANEQQLGKHKGCQKAKVSFESVTGSRSDK